MTQGRGAPQGGQADIMGLRTLARRKGRRMVLLTVLRGRCVCPLFYVHNVRLAKGQRIRYKSPSLVHADAFLFCFVIALLSPRTLPAAQTWRVLGPPRLHQGVEVRKFWRIKAHLSTRLSGMIHSCCIASHFLG